MKEFTGYYRDLFKIDIPVEVLRTGESQIVLDPNKRKAKIEYLYEDELFEAFAELKLGLDYSPLLTTLYFQKDLSEEEGKYALMFADLTTPIRKAWAYRNALRYVERERVEKEVREIIEEMMMVHMWKEAETPVQHYKRGIYISTAYLLGKAVDLDVKVEFVGKEAKSWRKYLEFLERMAEEKPSPYLLIRIPPVVEAPYTVKVKKIPYPHYEVKSS